MAKLKSKFAAANRARKMPREKTMKHVSGRHEVQGRQRQGACHCKPCARQEEVALSIAAI